VRVEWVWCETTSQMYLVIQLSNLPYFKLTMKYYVGSMVDGGVRWIFRRRRGPWDKSGEFKMQLATELALCALLNGIAAL
jgi:hypothetical protein